MSEITALMVKELRERTGSGLMECKKALTETSGNIEQAIDHLRKTGAAKAAKKSSRVTAEGQIVIQVNDDLTQAIMLEVNCETDFVSRDENFNQFSKSVCEAALKAKTDDVTQISQLQLSPDNLTIEEARSHLIAKIGENVQLRRAQFFNSKNTLGVYVHGGRIGVVVELTGTDQELAKNIAMHVAATNPLVIAREDVPQAEVEREKSIFMAQAKESGKPLEIIEKMVSGRINKFLDEVSLEGQPFVKDPSCKVSELLKNSGSKVMSFKRFSLGEGIEKEEVDFAKEVMAQVKGD